MMRADNSLIDKRVYEFGSFRLNAVERVIERAGRPLSVAPKALDVLIALVESRGRIVEKEDLMRKVWPETFVEDNSLAFNVSVLRKLFRENGGALDVIETVPKRGYRFTAEVREVPQTEQTGGSAPQNAALNSLGPADTGNRLARTRKLLIALTTLTVIGIPIVIILAFYSHRTPKLTDRDKIVLADFTNTTGDPVFDGTLRQGLAVQLEQSPFLSLVSEERIQQIFRLMGRPADAGLTPEVAREVCERTASVVVLEGSIALFGSRYVLGLRARNCRTGNILDDEQTQAARKEDVLDALSQIASRFRTRVGESLQTLEKHDTPLAEATTTSLEALKAYSAASKVLSSTGSAAALPLFQRAIEIDPNFATAHAWLGRMYGDLGELALSAGSTSKAWQLRDRASDPERFLSALPTTFR
jgi:eukaryotic-like serine/threonine-protein kinase